MLFEGPEKKVEMLVSADVPSLRARGREFWAAVVAEAGATILSECRSELCDAYLLSESSLFVYDRRVVLITCGETTLVSAVLYLQENLPEGGIESLIYERKNEHFPSKQPTSFRQDVALLQDCFGGEVVRFGDLQGHHIWLYDMGEPFQPDPLDTTLEVLMHGISPAVAKFFAADQGDTATVRRRTEVDRLIPGFIVDDHLFEPFGYSLNALQDDQYYTVHVTPQDPGSYVSFETNYRFRRGETGQTIQRVIDLFQPRRFDVLLFQDRADLESLHQRYRVEAEESRVLKSGYRVQFGHFDRSSADSNQLEMAP